MASTSCGEPTTLPQKTSEFKIGPLLEQLFVSSAAIKITRDSWGVSIQLLEVEFLDLLKSNWNKSIYQRCSKS